MEALVPVVLLAWGWVTALGELGGEVQRGLQGGGAWPEGWGLTRPAQSCSVWGTHSLSHSAQAQRPPVWPRRVLVLMGPGFLWRPATCPLLWMRDLLEALTRCSRRGWCCRECSPSLLTTEPFFLSGHQSLLGNTVLQSCLLVDTISHQSEPSEDRAGAFFCWCAKATQRHAVSVPSWAGVPLPQKHNGSGLLRCDPSEGGEHQVVRAKGEWVGPALWCHFLPLKGKKDSSCPLLRTHRRGEAGLELLQRLL